MIAREANHPPTPPGESNPDSIRRQTIGLGLLFGTAYFIQGIGEPTEGLIAQPVRSLLKSWGHSASSVATFWAVLSIPWSIKPLYGLLSDFVPIFGSRRRSYLILTTGVTAIGFGCLFLAPPSSGGLAALALLLIVPTVGTAFSDVVIDALMIERGQPLGLTGRLQSIQWAAIYAATIGTGFVGGWLSQQGRQELGFLICGTATAVAFAMAVFFVRESPRACHAHASVGMPPTGTFATAVRTLWQAARMPGVMLAAGFLFLWNFNPFSSTVLYMFATGEIGFSEQFYGNLTSLFAVAAVAASVAYGFYCRAVPFDTLIHLSIITGALATLAYWGLVGEASAVAVTLVAGFTYMTGNLIQLDLAARLSPPEAAGTVFALLMSLTNLSVLLSGAVGGPLYDEMTVLWGGRTAFNILVALGASFTAACWLLMPLLRRVDWDRAAAR